MRGRERGGGRGEERVRRERDGEKRRREEGWGGKTVKRKELKGEDGGK